MVLLINIKHILLQKDIVKSMVLIIMKPLVPSSSMTQSGCCLPLQQLCACISANSILVMHIWTTILLHAFTCANFKASSRLMKLCMSVCYSKVYTDSNNLVGSRTIYLIFFLKLYNLLTSDVDTCAVYRPTTSHIDHLIVGIFVDDGIVCATMCSRIKSRIKVTLSLSVTRWTNGSNECIRSCSYIQLTVFVANDA